MTVHRLPWLLAAALALQVGGAAASPAAPVPQDNAALKALLGCRALTAPDARLACFDTNTKTIADAEAAHSIIVLDRDQVRKTRRSLFGFEVPAINIFGPAQTTGETAESQEITAVARAARQDSDGGWIVTLDDGARWRQTDGQPVALPPRAGSKIVLRRAALGSYFMRIDGQPGVKAQRIG